MADTVSPARDRLTGPGERGSVSHIGKSLFAVIWLAGIVVCVMAFVWVAEQARQAAIPSIDQLATERLRGLASADLDALMSAVTALGSTPVLGLVAALAIALLAAHRRPAWALFVGVAFVGTLVLNDQLKLLYERPRPAFDWAEVRPEYSFPSGHAMNATVVYLAIAIVVWRHRGWRAGLVAGAVALPLVVAVSISRVYLGVHWLTDVVGGLLAGLLWLAFAATVIAAASDRWQPDISRGRGRTSREIEDA
jgi:undecaprenyl-diphosphatase